MGIPSSRLPGNAAGFAGDEGVVYLLRIPMTDVQVPVPRPFLAAEQEVTLFHTAPKGTIIKALSPRDIGPLVVNNDNLLSPGDCK